jgi:hypothetical protein
LQGYRFGKPMGAREVTTLLAGLAAPAPSSEAHMAS